MIQTSRQIAAGAVSWVTPGTLSTPDEFVAYDVFQGRPWRGVMARFRRTRWPSSGPVLTFLSYLDELHVEAGLPSLTDIGRAVALAPSTLSGFFSGARLISRGNLELVTEYLGGDVKRAEALRRKAVAAWVPDQPAPGPVPEPQSAEPAGAARSRLDLLVFATPVNRLNRPERLLGRDTFAQQIHALLDHGQRVVLHGLGGSGKTALAATIGDERIAAGKGSYVWLRPGNDDIEVTLDAIVRAFGTPSQQALVSACTGDARAKAVSDLVAATGITLWIIDDVWQPPVLVALLQAIPATMSVLVTSRLKLGIGHQFEVGGLEPGQALALLGLHSRQEPGTDAVALCRDLGYHPYALEIAGRHLHHYRETCAELRETLARSSYELSMPNSLAPPGRESIHVLLARTCDALDSADARLALQAIGAFHSGKITIELLAIYLRFDTVRARAALNRLVDVSMAKRLPGTSAYEVHDLTFAYARSFGAPGGTAAIAEFAATYSDAYHLLASEMDNLLASAAVAQKTDPVTFLAIVEVLATGGYLDDHGHTLGLLRLLDTAISYVESDGPRVHTLLTKRGNAAFNQGEFEEAASLYLRALTVAPTPLRRVVLHSVAGKALAELGRHDEAAQHFQRAYAIADAENSDEARLRILEQHSVAAFRKRDYPLVRDITGEGLALSRKLGARFQEAIFLNNLGTAEFELGVRSAVSLHQQAQAIAAEMNSDHVLALTHRTLGADFHAQEDFSQAQQHFTHALDLYVRLGQKASEAKLRQLMQRFGYLDPE